MAMPSPYDRQPSTVKSSVFGGFSVASIVFGCFLLLGMFAMWYTPYYLQRQSTLLSHATFIETGHCPHLKHYLEKANLAELLRKIDVELANKLLYVTYTSATVHGKETSCDKAEEFINTPLFLGAAADMCYDSVVYKLMTAQSPWVQALFGVCAIVFTFMFAKHFAQTAVRMWALSRIVNGHSNKSKRKNKYSQQTSKITSKLDFAERKLNNYESTHAQRLIIKQE